MLLEAMRGIDARLVVVGFGPYRATLEAMAPRADALHGAARASSSRAALAARGRDRRAVDLPRGIRHGRRRSSCCRLAAARRAPLRARRSRGRARGRSTRRTSGTSRRSRAEMPTICIGSCKSCSRCRARIAHCCNRPRGGLSSSAGRGPASRAASCNRPARLPRNGRGTKGHVARDARAQPRGVRVRHRPDASRSKRSSRSSTPRRSSSRTASSR